MSPRRRSQEDEYEEEEKEEGHDGPGQELGRRVAAAVISYQMGVSVAYHYKNLKGKTVGPYWVEAGRRLVSGMNSSVVDILTGPDPSDDTP